ncbi:MAG: hypothetical protein Q8J78_06290 [Moraxellaceae bacterium]|nr:hypothetical protein [Moraxellaceae bacterium]
MTPAEKIIAAAIRPCDTPTVRDQIRQLVELKYHVQRKTDHQLKIGPVNYYPVRGTITLDPCERHSERGFTALLELLERVLASQINTMYL